MYWAHVLQLHGTDQRHDVQVIGILVATSGRLPDIVLVGIQPDLRPLAHQRMVADLQAGAILFAQGVLGRVELGQGLAVDHPLPAVRQRDLALVAAVFPLFWHCRSLHFVL